MNCLKGIDPEQFSAETKVIIFPATSLRQGFGWLARHSLGERGRSFHHKSPMSGEAGGSHPIPDVRCLSSDTRTPPAAPEKNITGTYTFNGEKARKIFTFAVAENSCRGRGRPFDARVAESPRAFRRRDDLAEGLRQAVHRRYLILFTADEAGVVIERVVHGARRLEDLICVEPHQVVPV
jgi:toxin ParE1/3/4